MPKSYDEPGDTDDLHGELEMLVKHLDAIDTSSSGVGEALDAMDDLGDTALVCTDSEGAMIGATVDGEDLLDEIATIDRAVRNARRIVLARLTALEEGE